MTTPALTVLRRAVLGAVALLTLLAGVASTYAAARSTPKKIDWDTYAFGIGRQGFNAAENQLRPGNVHRLRQAWSTDLGATIDGQPLYAAGVVVRVIHRSHKVIRKNLILAATERGRVYALDASNGRRVWDRKVGYVDIPGCGDLGHFGVTGTPTIDRAKNNVYVADGSGRIDQLDLRTGRRKHSWTITREPRQEHVYSALTFVDGIVYAEIAGNCDNPPYHGQIVSINPRKGKLKRWFVTGQSGSNGGGIFGFAGISVDRSENTIYAATGNSLAATEHEGYAEHVVKLTLDLRVVSSNYPGLPGNDSDFGATPLLYRVPHCPPQLAVGNKYGSFYVYDRSRVGGGPVQSLSLGGSAFGTSGLLGIGAFWPDERTVFVSNPLSSGNYQAGMLAFTVTGNCRLALRWQAPGPGNLTSSPTIAGGLVFYGTGFDSRVIALNARTGKTLWITPRRVIDGNVFGAPTVVNDAVYVGGGHHVHAFKPR